MSFGFADELLVTLVVSWGYLTIVRFVDVNEREPVWALVVAFLFGAIAAGLATVFSGDPDIALAPWRQSAVIESAKFLALGASIALFAGVARVRGWSEFSDLTDGIVYGIAVGLGYSACDTMIREFASANLAMQSIVQTDGQAIVYSALGGLSQGVFAAVAGLGFGAAVDAKSRPAKIALPLLGLAGAIVLDALFFELRHGNALGGTAGLVRAWLAVLIPLALLVGVGLFSLSRERAAIRRELVEEVQSGLLTSDDLALLDSFWRRQMQYTRLLLQGRVATCLTIAGRHSRLVQLALLKRRADRLAGTRAADVTRAQAAALREVLLRARPATTLALVIGVAIALAAVSPGAAQSQETQWPSTDSLLSFAKRDIDGFWRRELGALYRPPAFVGAYPPNAVCRFKRGNAQYCGAVQSIYYDPAFLDEQYHQIGDFAAVWVMAHEWGHRVQDLQGRLGSTSGMFSIQIELQADCYAGRYTRDAKVRGILSPGDDEEAVKSLRGAHDPLDFPWFETNAHGTSGQRIDAFEEGFAGRDCEGDKFWRRVHVDPGSAPATTPPNRGAIIGTLACRRGRFDQVELRPAPNLVKGPVTDAVDAKFRSRDGVEVHLIVEAFSTAEAADTFAGAASLDGYSVTKSGPVKDGDIAIGKWKVLTGKTEIIVFQRKQLVNLAEGPSGVAWEFMSAAPVFDCKP